MRDGTTPDEGHSGPIMDRPHQFDFSTRTSWLFPFTFLCGRASFFFLFEFQIFGWGDKSYGQSIRIKFLPMLNFVDTFTFFVIGPRTDEMEWKMTTQIDMLLTSKSNRSAENQSCPETTIL